MLLHACKDRRTNFEIAYVRTHTPFQTGQEAQLSQRDRATLRVIEYFAKSIKFTQSHSK